MPPTIPDILSLVAQYVTAEDAREYSTSRRALTLLAEAWREYEKENDRQEREEEK